MRFWKKKEKKEPEATTTNPFEQSDAPQQPPARVDSPQGRYGTSNNNYQQDRQNLFNGYNDKPNQSAQRTSGNDGYNVQETEEDEDVAQLQKQIRNVKQDTLQSTRNALQKISETEDSAANTMNMLGQQSINGVGGKKKKKKKKRENNANE
jgi:hypothetical protein